MLDEPLLCCWAARQTEAPHQPWDHEGRQARHLQPFCRHTIMPFSLSVQYSTNYMTYLTFYYKVAFVFDGFAI